eukprot:5205958-Pyramimonas_sp.AAC.1
MLFPTYLSRPGLPRSGLGYAPADYPNHHQLRYGLGHATTHDDPTIPPRRPPRRPDQRQLTLGDDHARAPCTMLTRLLQHVRDSETLPVQSYTSQTVAISKKGKHPCGDPVHDLNNCLRMLHVFCPFWRLYLRSGL